MFIVIAVGAGGKLTLPASLGALAACLTVAAVGFVAHRPLARVPENTMKLLIGVILAALGHILAGRGL